MGLSGKLKRIARALAGICVLATLAAAQGAAPGQEASVYIAPLHDGFASALTASFFKKQLPVTIVLKPSEATYQISYTLTDQKGKAVAQALAFGLGGVGGLFVGRGSITATVMVSKGGAVVYAYTVHKKGAGAVQKAAESFAKNWEKRLEAQ